ncbi:MAG: UPF0146 family protein [Methanobacteriaceae archaeon]
MWNDFSEYIIKSVTGDSANGNSNGDNNSFKVAEIGIGNFFKVANNIRDSGIDIIKIDINPQEDTVIFDDIKNPNIDLYDNVKIIYSIRPPYELHHNLINLAKTINATLIIKPLTNEFIDSKLNMNLLNYKKVNFYKYP